MNKIKEYDITPDTNLMNIIGKVNYSFSQTIGEYLDNAIDERIDGKKLNISVNIDNDKITIIDNGQGMEEKKLGDALTLARSAKRGKLGLYGMGLKAASMALGDYFEIITKTEKGELLFTKWDKAEWDKQKRWTISIETMYVGKIPGIEKNGTILNIKKLKVKTGDKIVRLRTDVGVSYASYIENKEVDIFVNGIECKAIRPKIIEGSIAEIDEKICNVEITGWVGLLKNAATKDMYGFNTFRCNRLITCYDKIGFDPHPALARLIGELHLKNVPININKTDWIRESKEFRDVEQLARERLAGSVKNLKLMKDEKMMSRMEKSLIELYKEGLAEALGEDALKPYTLPDRKKIERNEKKKERQSEEQPKEKEKKINKNEEKVEEAKQPKNKMKIKGKQYKYEFNWYAGGLDGPMYERKFSEGEKGLEIWINKDFPIVDITNDKAFYIFNMIADAVAKTMTEKSNQEPEAYQFIKETLLRETAKHIKKIKGQ